MTAGWAGSPCGLGLDHSLGRDAGETPARCRGLTGWPLGCRIVFLALFSRTKGHAWDLVIPLGPYRGLFGFEKTIQWVRMSAPAGCSPRGLRGMSYPFKGFESGEWARMGKMRGRAEQLLL
jgi:hypothetical protein